MTLRVCPAPGCPNLTRGGRCTACARQLDRDRGTRQQRGYDATHDAERAKWELILQRRPVPCARCRRLIHPGQPWDLGHTDDRTRWTGPEHPPCNRAAGGHTSQTIQRSTT